MARNLRLLATAALIGTMMFGSTSLVAAKGAGAAKFQLYCYVDSSTGDTDAEIVVPIDLFNTNRTASVSVRPTAKSSVYSSELSNGGYFQHQGNIDYVIDGPNPNHDMYATAVITLFGGPFGGLSAGSAPSRGSSTTYVVNAQCTSGSSPLDPGTGDSGIG